MRRMLVLVIVLTGGVGFFFEFLEGRIFFEFFDVVSQVGFFLFDLFFLDCACGRDGRGLIEVFGRDHEPDRWIRQKSRLHFIFISAASPPKTAATFIW